MKWLLALMYGSRAVIIAIYLLAPKTALTFYMFAAALGFTWLATVPPTAGLVGKLFGTRYLATLFGLTLLSHQIGGFFGAWLGGLAFVRFGDYSWMWYADIVLALAAALVNLPIREAPVHARRAWRRRPEMARDPWAYRDVAVESVPDPRSGGCASGRWRGRPMRPRCGCSARALLRDPAHPYPAGTRFLIGRAKLTDREAGGGAFLYAHVGMASSRCSGFSTKPDGSQAQRERGLQAFGQRQRVDIQRVQSLDQQARLRQQGQCLYARFGLAAAAVEQLQAQFRFEVGDRHADRRRNAPQGPRRARERAVVDGGDEDAQIVVVEGHLSIFLITPDFLYHEDAHTMWPS
jgi:hypothetical protein